MASSLGAEGCHVHPFLRLVRRDPRDTAPPLLLTLCDEHGDEIASATAPAGEAAVKRAILLLARSKTLRAGYRLMVLVADEQR